MSQSRSLKTCYVKILWDPASIDRVFYGHALVQDSGKQNIRGDRLSFSLITPHGILEYNDSLIFPGDAL